MKHRYPPEMYDFVIKNVKTMTDADLAQELNKIHGFGINAAKVMSYRKNHGITVGKDGKRPKNTSPIFPIGIYDFIKANVKGKSTKELTDLINEKYGEGTMTRNQVRSYLKNHKLPNGVDGRFKKGMIPSNKGKHQPTTGRMAETQFKKGNRPHNYKPVGTIVYNKDGYKVIKVSDEGRQRDKWVFLHRHNWEQEHGKIPPNHTVIFLDGNKENCSLGNLVLISCKENLEMMRQRLRTDNAELTKTGISIAKLSLAIRKRKGE